MKYALILAGTLLYLGPPASFAADELANEGEPIPATRPEMKAALESLKQRRPRIPLPRSAAAGFNDGRMRAAYLPETWIGGGNPQIDQTAVPKLDHQLIDPSFWVVSRSNHCYYCLGHQELKLRSSGLNDDTIAALDSDWSVFQPRQRAALTFSRKLTLEPHLVGEADIAALKQLFTDVEIIELTFHIARFNAMNRWADGLGLPQERPAGAGRSFETPTSERFQKAISVVAPIGQVARPPLPSLEEVKAALAACRERQARVSLLSEVQARKALVGVVGDRSPLNWERAMAQFAGAGPPTVAIFNTMATDDHLSVRLKAELALISAIHNRAWYAAGHAAHRLHGLGVSTDEMAALFETFPLPSREKTDIPLPSREGLEEGPAHGAASGDTPRPQRERGIAASHRLAAKLTAEPHTITDADIAAVRGHFSDAETAQIVHVICMANFFDRFTEALGLPLEAGICE